MTEYKIPLAIHQIGKYEYVIADANKKKIHTAFKDRDLEFFKMFVDLYNIVHGEPIEFEDALDEYVKSIEPFSDDKVSSIKDGLKFFFQKGMLVNAAKLKRLEDKLKKATKSKEGWKEQSRGRKELIFQLSQEKATALSDYDRQQIYVKELQHESIKLTAERDKLQEKLNVLSECVKKQVESDKSLKARYDIAIGMQMGVTGSTSDEIRGQIDMIFNPPNMEV